MPGGLKLENWPLVVGVEVVISGFAIVNKSGKNEWSKSNDPLILFSLKTG